MARRSAAVYRGRLVGMMPPLRAASLRPGAGCCGVPGCFSGAGAAGAAGIAKILFVRFLIVAAVMLVLALMGGKAVSKNL